MVNRLGNIGFLIIGALFAIILCAFAVIAWAGAICLALAIITGSCG